MKLSYNKETKSFSVEKDKYVIVHSKSPIGPGTLEVKPLSKAKEMVEKSKNLPAWTRKEIVSKEYDSKEECKAERDKRKKEQLAIHRSNHSAPKGKSFSTEPEKWWVVEIDDRISSGGKFSGKYYYVTSTNRVLGESFKEMKNGARSDGGAGLVVAGPFNKKEDAESKLESYKRKTFSPKEGSVKVEIDPAKVKEGIKILERYEAKRSYYDPIKVLMKESGCTKEQAEFIAGCF
jgi:hypothetical protein